MNNKRAAFVAFAGLLAAAGLSGVAVAAPGDASQEATALNGSTITLTQAIATAEQQTGGRAYDAGVDVSNGQTQLIVETNGPNGVQTVSVNAQSGAIISTHAGSEPDGATAGNEAAGNEAAGNDNNNANGVDAPDAAKAGGETD